MWSFLKQTPRHREVKSSFPCLDSFCLWGRAARCGTGLPLRAGPSDALGKWSLPADLSVYCPWAELAPSVSLGSLDSQELCCCLYWIYADCVCPGRRHILSCSMGLKVVGSPRLQKQLSMVLHLICRLFPSFSMGKGRGRSTRKSHAANWWTVAESYNSCQRHCCLNLDGTEEVKNLSSVWWLRGQGLDVYSVPNYPWRASLQCSL